jgi:hypothetical protein
VTVCPSRAKFAVRSVDGDDDRGRARGSTSRGRGQGTWISVFSEFYAPGKRRLCDSRSLDGSPGPIQSISSQGFEEHISAVPMNWQASARLHALWDTRTCWPTSPNTFLIGFGSIILFSDIHSNCLMYAALTRLCLNFMRYPRHKCYSFLRSFT